ncbi:MAG: RND transporter, partial [Lachnospiraceae bacterium]|nr:RND transporter [Lachnospiraceae bacterium]
VVKVKPSPLGNRYVLSRSDVEVLASDDTSSAVSGGLYGYEYVVTNSSKPLEAGMKVRLANE